MKRKSRSRSTSPSKRRKSAKDHHLALPRRILKRKLEANNAERAAKRIRTESPTRVVNETLPAISVRAPEPETSEARFFRALEEKDIGTLGWIFETISETENDLCRGVMEGHISAYINGLIEAGIAAEDDGEDFLKDEVEVIVTWIEEYPFIVDFYQNFRHDGLSLLCAASKAGLVRIVEAVLLLKKKLVADAITVRAAEVTHVEPDLNEDVHMADADNEERAAVVDIEAREGEFERTALGIAIEAMMELYRKDNSASIFKLKRLEETIWQLVKAGAEPAVFEYSLNAARLHILMDFTPPTSISTPIRFPRTALKKFIASLTRASLGAEKAPPSPHRLTEPLADLLTIDRNFHLQEDPNHETFCRRRLARHISQLFFTTWSSQWLRFQLDADRIQFLLYNDEQVIEPVLTASFSDFETFETEPETGRAEWYSEYCEFRGKRLNGTITQKLAKLLLEVGRWQVVMGRELTTLVKEEQGEYGELVRKCWGEEGRRHRLDLNLMSVSRAAGVDWIRAAVIESLNREIRRFEAAVSIDCR